VEICGTLGNDSNSPKEREHDELETMSQRGRSITGGTGVKQERKGKSGESKREEESVGSNSGRYIDEWGYISERWGYNHKGERA